MEQSLETLLAEANLRCLLIADSTVTLPWQTQPFVADCDRLYLIRGGRGWIAIDDAQYHLTPDMVLLIPSGAVQQGQTESGHPLDLIWIHFHAQTQNILPLLRMLPLPVCLQGNSARAIHQAGKALWDEWMGALPGRGLALKQYLLQMVLCACRAAEKDCRAPDGTLGDFRNPVGKDTEHLRQIHAVLQTIESRFHAPLRLEDLAEIANLHPTHFHRVFRNLTGMPPMKCLEQRRMRHARELLASTTQSMQDISLQCGYEDPYYFSRVFRRVCGQSPTNFRRSVSSNPSS